MPTLTAAGAVVSLWGATFLATPLLQCGAYLLLLFSGLCLMNIVSREDLSWLRGLLNTKTKKQQ